MSNFPAGSKIIIKNADRGEVYENGDILTIANTDDNSGCGVYATFNGEVRYVSNREFEVYTESVEVGDRVRVLTDSDLPYLKKGDVGTVMEIGYGLRIQQDAPFTRGDGVWWVEANNAQIEEPLDVTPRTIAFEGILKGDTIRAEYVANGVKLTREGVADKQPHYGWVNGEGMLVADTAWGATYTLLERPEPPKPNPFAEAGIGSVAGEKDGYVWLKTANNNWQFFRQTSEHSLSDTSHNDRHMNNGRWTLLHTA